MEDRRAPIQDVNIEAGDNLSRALYRASTQTHENRPGLLVEFEQTFSGARAIPLSWVSDPDNILMNLGLDGVGTKVEVSERQGDHSSVAFDLFAMVCDDAVVRGAEPVAIGSILDVRQLSDDSYTKIAVQQLAQGYVAAARKAGVVVVNGEVAELGDRVGGHGSFNYNWGATVLWLTHRERILTGKQMKPGDSLVGLVEPGFRSNGITDVRKAMLQKYGQDWHNVFDNRIANGERSLGQLVQTPSTIYTRFVTELTGGFDIEKTPKAKVTGVAHITGGGMPGKLHRMMEPSGGLGVVINEPITPPDLMLEVQRIRELEDYEAYGKWHMGPGMVIATPEPDEVLSLAEEWGVEAKRIGNVTDQDSKISIKNKGAKGGEHWLRF